MPSSGASWRTRGRLLAVPLDKEEPRPSEKPHVRANLFTIRRLIAT
jgi:hypothetical protein